MHSLREMMNGQILMHSLIAAPSLFQYVHLAPAVWAQKIATKLHKGSRSAY